jgi:NTE family protein
MTKRNISKLLICGGGFKFFYLYGAIKYLDEINILQNITEYIGVSAGGLLCTLFSIGYTPKDIELFILEFNFEKLLDPHLDSLLEKKGLDNGEIKKVAIQQFFTKKDIDPEITFKQLYELTNKKINFIAANLTLNKLEILNYETYPDMEVWKGLLITTALPFLYEPVIHNEQFLADGGLFDNYPIELFIDDDNNNILGINLIFNINFNDMDIDFLNYMSNLLLIAHHWKNNNKTNNYKKYTISINVTNSLELINTVINYEERIKRIEYGYECAVQYFIDNKEDSPEETTEKPEETPKETEEKPEESENLEETTIPDIIQEIPQEIQKEDIYAVNGGIDYII